VGLAASATAALCAALRPSDLAGRHQDGQLLVLLPGTGRPAALAVASRVRRAVAAVRPAGIERAVSASLGVAVFPEDGTNRAALLAAAGEALAAAANRGNRVASARPARARASGD
jgi:diguanylate cyclase (GGDEF)-like protein